MTTVDTIRLDQLDARIRAVWGRGQLMHFVAGLLALLRWAVPLFLLGMLIDWVSYMPSAGRLVILVTLVCVSLVRAWRCGWRHLRPFDAVRTALQLEAQHGGLNSLLVTAIQFRNDKTSTGSGALRELTCRQAEQAAADIKPEQAVPYRPLRQPGVIALVLAGIIVVFAALNASFLAAGLARIFNPWSAVQYPTNTQITLAPEELVVKEGDSALIEAKIGGVVPEQARIYVRTGDKRAREIDLDVAKGSCVYNIASASRDFTYRFKAGDDRTDWQSVRVIPAPRIEEVAVELIYPEYLGKEPETIEALTLTVPEGTRVSWRVALDKPISAAQFIRDGESPVDLEVSDDGRVVTFKDGVTDSRGYSFAWVEKEHGFHFESPRYYLQVASDQAPRVELTSPSENLVAMLGRPLKLAVRAQDDHGIGSTTIAYRVNQHDEVNHELKSPIQSGEGEQPLDWDYRKALPDLSIGDTVSFTIRASDRYPGPEGPHIVRSETRRITFLSREQYLEQIEKQKDRLLSRVQTIYRQQRSAHEVVRGLSPDMQGYMQACQLEAIRQEMVRDQIRDIAGQMQWLLDDLAANSVSDAAAGESLETVRTALLEIADTHIANAASQLRGQLATTTSREQADPGQAARTVNKSARELGSLVLLRGIDAAQEVYAREARMLALVQASLRWRTVMNPQGTDAEKLTKHQEELAQWTGRLITDLQTGMRYDKRPLAVLRLIRSVKDLRDAGTESKMNQAGELIREGKTQQAADLQAELVTTLLNAEFSVRLSGAYSTLLRTRAQIALIESGQAQLARQNESLAADAFSAKRPDLAERQAALRKQLVTLLLPTVPAPRASLFDQTPPQIPPVRELLAKTDKAMADALKQLKDGKQKEAATKQFEAEASLTELVAIVDRWSVQMGLETQGLGTVVAATSERMSRLEEFEARVIGLLEKTDIAASEDEKVDGLAESQLILADELAAFRRELDRQNRAEPDRDLLPLLSRLARAEQSLNAAVQSLKDNDADKAIGEQEQAADSLAEAYAIVVAQNERLGLLQDLLMFQRSVGFASGYMADIVAEQRDLLAATEALEPKEMAVLLPQFGNMRNCLNDVAPLLDLVAARMDAGTPLVFAKTDFEDAMASLQSGDKFDAVDAQDVAAESLAEVQSRVEAVRTQTGYVAEIVESLHATTSDISLLQHEQAELRNKVLSVDSDGLKALAQEQDALRNKIEQADQLIEATAGRPKLVLPADPRAIPPLPERTVSVFTKAALPTRDAAKLLAQGDGSAAAEAMELAEATLAENTAASFTVIEMLHGLPQVTIDAETEPALVRLVDVLALASEQRSLSRTTRIASAEILAQLAEAQEKLTARCKDVAAVGEPHPLLDQAHKQLTEAQAAFAASDEQKLAQRQQVADTLLRQFIVEQSLILNTKIPPPAASDLPATDGEGSDTESALSAGFISDFVSGETPQDKRTEWKVLAERNRAALNQNFARELPLEYRGLLKDYYERVAK